MADWMEGLMEAFGIMLGADATLRTLMGKPTGPVAVEFRALEYVPGDLSLPIIAIQLLPFHQTSADGDTRQGWVQFTAVAEESATVNAQLLANNIIAEVVQAVSATAFTAQGLDIVPREHRRLNIPLDREYTRGLHRADVEILIEGMQVPATL